MPADAFARRPRGVYARRIIGGDCDHRRFGGAVVAGGASGARSEPANEVRQSPEADRLALHNYHDTQNTLPFGSPGNKPATPNFPIAGTWGAFILPFLESGNHFDLFDFKVPMAHANNVNAVTRFVPTYLCPSDVGPARGDFGESRRGKPPTTIR